MAKVSHIRLKHWDIQERQHFVNDLIKMFLKTNAGGIAKHEVAGKMYPGAENASRG